MALSLKDAGLDFKLLNELQLLKRYDLPVLEQRSRRIVHKSASLLHARSTPLIFHVSESTEPKKRLPVKSSRNPQQRSKVSCEEVKYALCPSSSELKRQFWQSWG